MSDRPRPPIVYGAPLDDVEVVDVPVAVAELFAAAHHRLRPESVGVHRGDGVVEVTHPAPTGPDGGTDRWVPPTDDVVDAIRSAARPVVLAGPDVIRCDAVAGMQALAAAASLGVLNTWGAKGLFDWRSRHHLATAGLQADDFALAGFGDADLIVAVGVDEAEATSPWRLAPVVEVHPWSLAPLAELVGRAPAPIPMPPLRDRLAAVAQGGWTATTAPLPPSAVTRTYGARFAGTGVVAADPGVAGFWVARTLPTSGLRGAIVSGDAAAVGSAVATAVVARLLDPRRPTLAVVDELGEVGLTCREAGERLGVRVPVERWSPDGDRVGAQDHADRLDRLVETAGTATLCTDAAQMDEVVAAAGAVTAWT